MSKSIEMTLAEYTAQNVEKIIIGRIAYRDLEESKDDRVIISNGLITFNGIIIEESSENNYWEIINHV